MPVSWQSRLSVDSATAMLRIIVPSMRFAPASRSRAASASKPRFTSGGRRFSARMYSSFAASSTWRRSTFTAVESSFHVNIALFDDLRPQRRLLLDGAGELLRRVAHRREALHVEPGAQIARLE